MATRHASSGKVIELRTLGAPLGDSCVRAKGIRSRRASRSLSWHPSPVIRNLDRAVHGDPHDSKPLTDETKGLNNDWIWLKLTETIGYCILDEISRVLRVRILVIRKLIGVSYETDDEGALCRDGDGRSRDESGQTPGDPGGDQPAPENLAVLS